MRQTMLVIVLIAACALLLWQQVKNIGKVDVQEVIKLVPVEKVRYVTVTGTIQKPSASGKIEKAPYSITIKEQTPGGEFVFVPEKSTLPDVMTVDDVQTSQKLDLLSVIRLGAGARLYDAVIYAMPFLGANVRVYGVLEAGLATDFETVGVNAAVRYHNIGAYGYTDFKFERFEIGLFVKPF